MATIRSTLISNAITDIGRKGQGIELGDKFNEVVEDVSVQYPLLKHAKWTGYTVASTNYIPLPGNYRNRESLKISGSLIRWVEPEPQNDATWGAKKIYANKAVISAVHIKPTFMQLVGPQHLDRGFLQRIKDLSLKGGSLYMTHFLTRERLRYRPQFRRPEYKYEEYGSFQGPFFPMDSRELYFDHVTHVLVYQRNLTIPPEKALYGMVSSETYAECHPQCTRPGRYIYGPLFVLVPTPQYNVDGAESMEEKAKWDEYMRRALGAVVENLDSDNLVHLGLGDPEVSEPEWLFQDTVVPRIWKVKRLHRDLGVNWAGIGVVLDLLDRIDDLEREVAWLKKHL